MSPRPESEDNVQTQECGGKYEVLIMRGEYFTGIPGPSTNNIFLPARRKKFSRNLMLEVLTLRFFFLS